MNTALPFRTALGTLLTVITLLLGMTVTPTGAAAAQPFHATTSGAGLRPTAQRWHAARNLSLSQLPANLASVVRRTLATQAARDYFLFHDGKRYLAANPDQHLQTVFTADGAHVSTAGAAHGWSWGVHLEAVGRNTIDHVPTAVMVARGDTLLLQHGTATEWYRNGPRGIEQGFTLHVRPNGSTSRPVRLQLRLTGSLQARLERGDTGLALQRADGSTVLRYTGLAAHDASGRTLAARLALHGTHLWLVVHDRGARYPVSIDPWMEGPTLSVSLQSKPIHQGFGYSVSLSTDGATALLGEPVRGVNGRAFAGAGDIFSYSNGGWSLTAELNLGSNAAEEDELGSSASLSGDGKTALLGAPIRTVNGQQLAGAAEVFTLSNGTWSAATELSLGAQAAAKDTLGSSVALNNDGTTAILGAPTRSVNGQQLAGAAEVFTNNNGTWSAPTELSLGAQAAAKDELGYSVALSGAGVTALIGVPARTVNGDPGAGAAEVFTHSNGSWGTPIELNLGANAAANDKFGFSVALGRNGTTALVGVPNRSVNGQSGAGAAEAYTYGNGSWGAPTELNLGSDAFGGDAMGFSAALSSDGTTALLGAPDRSVSGQQDAGEAEVFVHGTSGWSFSTGLNLSAGAAGANDILGFSVAVSGDGSLTLLGAPGRTVNGQTNAGDVRVFNHTNGQWFLTTHLNTFGVNPDDFLGISAALNSDGTVALVGAAGRTVNGQGNAGAAEVFMRSSGIWTLSTELSLGTNAAASDYLGSAVALSGDGSTALVDDLDRTVNSQANAGAVEVFTRVNGTWNHTTEFNLGSNAASAIQFGYSLALSGDGNTALAGSPAQTVSGLTYAGAAEVYSRSNGIWSGPTELTLGTNEEAQDSFGASVALNGNGTTALIGDLGRVVNGQRLEGAGEVFTRTNGSWSFSTELSLGASAARADQLGWAVALSSDGATALASAPGRTVNGQSAAGAAEVFTRTNGSWSGPTQLDLGAKAAANDSFGESVGLSSDGATALIGAPVRTVNGQSAAGAAEVFTRANGAWSFTTELNLGSGAAAKDQVGISVALSGDGATVLAGTSVRSVNGQSGAGAAEVFTLANGDWRFSIELTMATGSAALNISGAAVALSGDGSTALVGAPTTSVNGQQKAGVTDVFTNSSGSWSFSTELSLGTTAAPYDQFGRALALSRDGSTALIGASGRIINGRQVAGAAEVFTRGNGSWSAPTELSLGANASTNDLLGSSVKLSGDGAIALVGAPGRAVNGQSGAGTAELFTYGAGSWSPPTELSLGAHASAGDDFGFSVALSSDGAIALAGAPGRTVIGQQKAGAAEAFTRGTGGWSAPTELSLGAQAQANDALGQSIALSSDGSTALAGAPDRTVNEQQQAGAAEVFTRGNGSWSAPTELSLGANASTNDLLGFSVALNSDGATALIGAPERTAHAEPMAGTAEVFTLNNGGRRAPIELDLGSNASIASLFGLSVALTDDGAIALIGAPGSAVNGQLGAGVAQIFVHSGTTAAHVSRFQVAQQGRTLMFHWRVSAPAGLIGFNLYAGAHQLNAHLIPIHTGLRYSYRTRTSSSGPYRLHLVLANGQEIVVSPQ